MLQAWQYRVWATSMRERGSGGGWERQGEWLERSLNQFGQQGWELMQMVPMGTQWGYNNQSTLFVFKRPAGAPPPPDGLPPLPGNDLPPPPPPVG